MSTTDELRRSLDERGIEWKQGKKDPKLTCWTVGGWRMSAKELANGKLLLQKSSRGLTLDQAIAEMLDGGKCEIIYKGDLRWECQSCNEQMRITSDRPNFCPNCGKAVKR